jgi:hypothetical protein
MIETIHICSVKLYGIPASVLTVNLYDGRKAKNFASFAFLAV